MLRQRTDLSVGGSCRSNPTSGLDFFCRSQWRPRLPRLQLLRCRQIFAPIGLALEEGVCLHSILVLKGALNRTASGHLFRHPLLLPPLGLRPMPPRKASTWRSMAFAARSQAPASPPISQPPPPPPATAVGVEQFDLLVQQVRGLTEAVQAMQ